MIRRLLVQCLLVIAVGCGGGSPSTPTTPSPTPAPAPTRTVRLAGDLAFGSVQIGASADRTFVISNDGNSPLTVSSITGPAGGAFTASWTNGAVAAGAAQSVVLRFTPTAAQNYGGLATVVADHTSGLNTIALTAVGVAATATTPPVSPPTTPLPDGWDGTFPPRSSGGHPVCQVPLPNNARCINNLTGPPQALCDDRAFSCSTGTGTCSSHGGVYCWRN
jgi:hypothetical protein